MQNNIAKFEDRFYQEPVQKVLIYIASVVAFVSIFALNHLFPIYADDMMYSVVKYKETINLGDNLCEIGKFLHYYYFNWGGRIVAHVVAHILLLFNLVSDCKIYSIRWSIAFYFSLFID